MKSIWIKKPVSLTGNIVSLISLEKKHFAELEILAQDQRIWEFYIADFSNPINFRKAYEEAIQERDNGTQFPFVILNRENKLLGSTRFLDLQPENMKLEIGWTWLHPDYWKTPVNLESKILLLTFCFEKLSAVRVQFKTDERNIRSRKAIEKIGGVYEGVFRNDMLRQNGSKRNSAYYSIIDEDWIELKSKLINELNNKISL